MTQKRDLPNAQLPLGVPPLAEHSLFEKQVPSIVISEFDIANVHGLQRWICDWGLLLFLLTLRLKGCHLFIYYPLGNWTREKTEKPEKIIFVRDSKIPLFKLNHLAFLSDGRQAFLSHFEFQTLLLCRGEASA